jgi:hypothetical protein
MNKVGEKKKQDSVDKRVLGSYKIAGQDPWTKGQRQSALTPTKFSYSITRCREPFECFFGPVSQHLKLVTESFSRVDSIKVTKQHPTVHMALLGN